MNEDLKKHANDYLYASYDNDMVGMFTTTVNFFIFLRKNYVIDHFDVVYQPENYYKLEPHIPKQEIVENSRKLFKSLLQSNEDSIDIKVKNIYTALIGISFCYHFPVEMMNTYAILGNVIDRDIAIKTLERDGMSSNWIQDPSGKDYTEFLL